MGEAICQNISHACQLSHMRPVFTQVIIQDEFT